MHPEIEVAIQHSFEGAPQPNDVAKVNAHKLIRYITHKGLYEDNMINTTWTGGLSIFLTSKEWQFHMQANNEGRIVYIVFKGSNQLDCGSMHCDEYIPVLIYYLNTIKMSA
jgi:hypothetical protein